MINITDTSHVKKDVIWSWILHFAALSKDRQQGRWRLLLCDQHGSHLDNRTESYCKQEKIIIWYLPPHITHYLQPLDLVVFQPYKH